MDPMLWEIAETATALRRAFDRRAVSLGVTRAQWRVLAKLNRMPGLRQVDLADHARHGSDHPVPDRRSAGGGRAGRAAARPAGPPRVEAGADRQVPAAGAQAGRVLADDLADEAFGGMATEQREAMRATLATIRDNVAVNSRAERPSANERDETGTAHRRAGRGGRNHSAKSRVGRERPTSAAHAAPGADADRAAAAAGRAAITGWRAAARCRPTMPQVKQDIVSVSAQVNGPITEVAVRNGQHVKRGDLLFRIDPAPFRVALAQAAGADRRGPAPDPDSCGRQAGRHRRRHRRSARPIWRSSSRALARQSALLKQGFTTRSAMTMRSREVRKARDRARQCPRPGGQRRRGDRAGRAAERSPRRGAALDKARLDLSRTEVRAPMDGIVEKPTGSRSGRRSSPASACCRWSAARTPGSRPITRKPTSPA